MSSSVVAARALGKRGIPVTGVAFDDRNPLVHSKYCTETHIVPAPTGDYPGFLERLAEVAAQPGVLTWVPLNEYGIYTLSEHRDCFDSLSLPVVAPETFRQVWDLTDLLSIAADLGIPVPDHALLGEWTDWSQPTVIKSRYSVVDSRDALREPSVEFHPPGGPPDAEAVREAMGHEPLVQRYVDNGTEYGFFAVCADGEPLATFQHRRIRSTNYFGGASAHREAADNPTIEEYGRDLLAEMEWTGPAMVEFRRNDVTGEYKLMEINPRFWGSLALGISAGVDFPWYYYQLAADMDVTAPERYDTAAKASYLRAELQYLKSVASGEFPAFIERPPITESVVEMARSIPGSAFDMVDLGDPLPFLWDYVHSVYRLRK
jgi:predicted ATP-grasp superfamily ATP-dependent carboligase